MTDNLPILHVLDLIDAAVAGGLNDAERRRVEEHVESCPSCAAALADARKEDAELRALFERVRPDSAFEDRLIGGVRREALARRSRLRIGKHLPEKWRHPLVRLAATGVAAAIVVGAVGLGATYGLAGGIDGSPLRLPRLPWAKAEWDGDRSQAATHSHQNEVEILGGTQLQSDVRADAGRVDMDKANALGDVRSQAPSEMARRKLETLGRASGDLDVKRSDSTVTTEFEPGISANTPLKGDLYLRSAREPSKNAAPLVPGVPTYKDSIYTYFDGKNAGADAAARPARVSGGGQSSGPASDDGRRQGQAAAGKPFVGHFGAPAQPVGANADSVKRGETTAELSKPAIVVEKEVGQKQLGLWSEKIAGAQAAPGAKNAFDRLTTAIPKLLPAGGEVRDLSLSESKSAFASGGTTGDEIRPPNVTWGLPDVAAKNPKTAQEQGKDPALLRFGEIEAAGAGGPTAPVAGRAFKSAETSLSRRSTSADVPDLKETPSFDLNGAATRGGGGAGGGRVWADSNAKTPTGISGPDPFLNDPKSAQPPQVFFDPNAGAMPKLTPADPTARGLTREDRKQSTEKLGDEDVDKIDGLSMLSESKNQPLGAEKAEEEKKLAQTAREPEAIKEAVELKDKEVLAREKAADGKDPRPLSPPADGPAPAPPAKPAEAPVKPPELNPIVRKIIRNGEMTFEVDSFDNSAMQIARIATEETGYVSTTDSEKLPNGKVKGTIILRVPPEHLDTLVLKLRALGELKSQKINAQDVTKQYTDVASQLRAAKTMEERMLEIIKNGKGSVKDLVEAEKQLGVWREKAEALEGEIRYFDSLVSLSTLSITLYERDVKSPTAAAEVEQVNMGVETEDVEKSRAEAIKAIDAARGRVIQAELKQLDSGQFTALVVAEVPPDASGPMIDRLRQLGKVARLDVQRKQVATGGTGPLIPGLKVERKPTQLQLSLYNLANIAPRQTNKLMLAADDVEKAYKSILEQVAGAGGKVLVSQLNRSRADQTSGTIEFQAPSDKAEVLLAALRGDGEVMRLDGITNPDTQSATDSKRGFVVVIQSLASVPSRETTQLQLAAPSVPESFNKLLDVARAAGARVITSVLNEQDPNSQSAELEFEITRDNWGRMEAGLKDAGLIVSRNVNRSPDAENTVDSKVKLKASLIDAVRLQPRETINVRVAAHAVPEAFNGLLNAMLEAGGRVINTQLNQQDNTPVIVEMPAGTKRMINPQDKATVNGNFAANFPRENMARVEAALKEAGITVDRAVARAGDGPMTVDTRVGLVVTVIDERALGARETIAETVVTASVSERYERIRDLLRQADAQVFQAQLGQTGPADVTGTLDFLVRRAELPAVEKALSDKADIFHRRVERSSDLQNTLEDKVRLTVTLKDAEMQPPRARYTMAAEVSDVEKSLASLDAAVVAVGGRKVDSTQTADRGKEIARVIVDVPLARAADIVQTVRGLGQIKVTERNRDENVPEGSLSRAQIAITLGTPDAIVKGERGLWQSIREGLSTSAQWLLTSLQILIVGLCVVVPWVVLIWFVTRVLAGRRRRREAERAAGNEPRSIEPPTGGGPAMPATP